MFINRSRSGLCAVAVLGAAFLLRFAERVESNALSPALATGAIVKYEAVAIHASARLIAFAKTHGPFESNDDLARAIREAGLEHTWFYFEIGNTQDDGTFHISKQFIRPGEHNQLFGWATIILGALAGRPSDVPMLDFRRAEVLVIDESYMERDPFDAIEELAELRLAKPGVILPRPTTHLSENDKISD